jgi:hypothetical protein
MFKYLLMSIVIVPILIGITTAKRYSGRRALSSLTTGCGAYGVLWIGMLCFLTIWWLG